MGTQDQPTSNPYSADNLPTRDEGLEFAKEFGTNNTTDVGELWNGSGVIDPQPEASIDARLGVLQLNSFNMDEGIDENYAPRGRTFLGPDLTTFPITTVLGVPAHMAVIYAHTLLIRESFISEPTPAPPTDGWGGGFILGGDTLVGVESSDPFLSMDTLWPLYPTDVRSRATILVRDWIDGGGDIPDVCGGVPQLTPLSIYWRITTIQPADGPVKSTSAVVEWSNDGITWTLVCPDAEIAGEVQRYGYVSYGPCVCALDWVRFYSYVPTSFDDWNTIPLGPTTGGRLFVP